MYVEKKMFYIFIIILIVYTTIIFWRSFRTSTKSNTELATTRTELLETTDRLRRAEERNRELENRLNRYAVAVSDAADRLGELNEIFRENNGGLHSTIEQLQLIAEEVEALEDRLRFFNSNSSYSSASSCIPSKQGEQMTWQKRNLEE